MSTSILNSILRKSKENKEIISIWLYNTDKGSFVGYITEINEEYIGFRHFTRFGKQDGIIFIKVANIKNIDFNDDYTKVMECLIEYSDIIDKPSEFSISLNQSENWQFDALLQLHKAKEQLASIEINGNEYFTGFVKDISDEDFILNCVAKNGEDLGTSLFKIEDVTEIRVNDIDDRRRLLLYKWRKASL
ncbi:hypothetical protein C3L50_11765 [Flavobacterium alvei]|mgnify:FL=1|uniref:Uncharacterized protein n=1 Tax=Flavobacterium alvei TaxID=2080416 RepID=A0A2S5A8W3_9FLAO|nr:hypothetical protein [Flavobacterium alvei]POY38802.1 hypothetical protein C3L50_11765 [Flavobacterium alvei]